MYFSGIQDANIDEIRITREMSFSTLDDVRNFMRYGTTDVGEIQRKLGITQETRTRILQKFEEEYNR